MTVLLMQHGLNPDEVRVRDALLFYNSLTGDDDAA